MNSQHEPDTQQYMLRYKSRAIFQLGDQLRHELVTGWNRFVERHEEIKANEYLVFVDAHKIEFMEPTK